VVQESGDIDGAFGGASEEISREYASDFQYGAYLEPLNAVVEYSGVDNTAQVWAGTQAPTHTVRAVAKALGIEEDHVTLHRMYLGGAFGRKAAADQDWVADTARLSKQLGCPVKMMMTRTDDIKSGRFKPISNHLLRAAISPDGKLLGIHHRLVSDEPLSVSDPDRWEKNSRYAVTSGYGLPLPYKGIENKKAEAVLNKLPVRITPMRGVTGNVSAFPREGFIDELATKSGQDPLDYRLALVDGTSAAVLNKVAEMVGWRERGSRALGLSFIEIEKAYFATVAEVKLNSESGVLDVLDIWIAADVGIAVQPYNMYSQVEGGAIFAVSNSLLERITFKEGEIEQNNFDDYPLLKIDRTPRVHFEYLASDREPTGVADPVVVGIPAAIANGFAALTGKRLYRFPFTPDRVLEAMGQSD
jgi:isoquinoline 1-oxidoreductase beta subunit